MIKFLEKHRAISIILTILITIEIFYFSSLPGGKAGGGISGAAIIYHFVVFFLFTFLFTAALKGEQKLTPFLIIIILVLAFSHSLFDEFHQVFTPFRDASMRDIMINSLGIFTAMIVYGWTYRPNQKYSDHPSAYEEEYDNEHEEPPAHQSVSYY